MITIAIVLGVLLVIVAGDRLAKGLGFIVAFAWNFTLILVLGALRLTNRSLAR